MQLSIAEFRSDVLPSILSAWELHCFCENPQFLKLICFKFEDYRPRVPANLVDSEIVIAELICKRFQHIGEPDRLKRTGPQTWRCPQCCRLFLMNYQDYSISMYRTFVQPLEFLPIAPIGFYLIGFRSFAEFRLASITDFQFSESAPKFIHDLTASV